MSLSKVPSAANLNVTPKIAGSVTRERSDCSCRHKKGRLDGRPFLFGEPGSVTCLHTFRKQFFITLFVQVRYRDGKVLHVTAKGAAPSGG